MKSLVLSIGNHHLDTMIANCDQLIYCACPTVGLIVYIVYNKCIFSSSLIGDIESQVGAVV